MTNTHYLKYGFVLALILGLLFLIATYRTPQSHAATSPGLAARIATTSNPTVSSTAGVLIATSSECTSRIITTSGSPIMLTFSDIVSQTPTGSFGHIQAASTTVAYDSGLYGCGLVRVYSFATQLVTVSETK